MMPFFRSKSYSNYLTRHSIYKSKKFFAPLQVRTHKYVALLKQKKFSGKRALSWRDYTRLIVVTQIITQVII